MNRYDIQKLFDHPDSLGVVRLPAGEFEGTFTVNRPCIAVGDGSAGTTFWKRDGTVIEINSAGVTLKNISIEMTGSGSGEALVSKSADAKFENIFLSGAVRGIDGESGIWDIPKVINIGRVCSDSGFTAEIKVFVPVRTEIFLDISGMRAEPGMLSPGMNTIKLTVDPLSADSVIYGCLEYRSLFRRRTYINMSAGADGRYIDDGTCFYTASEHKPGQPAKADPGLPPLGRKRTEIVTEPVRRKSPGTESDLSSVRVPETASMLYSGAPSSDVITVIRGQRISPEEIFGSVDSFTAELRYDAAEKSLDIDGYAFLLNLNGIADNEKSLVFFGNTSGGDGSLTYTNTREHRVFTMKPAEVPQNIEKIAVAYSIYGDNPSDNFSKVRGARFILRGGAKVIEFPMDGFFLEKTIVAVEFYRRRDKWKMSAIGKGYSNGLKKLCRSYGLNVSG